MKGLLLAAAFALFLAVPSTCPADGEDFPNLKRQFDYSETKGNKGVASHFFSIKKTLYTFFTPRHLCSALADLLDRHAMLKKQEQAFPLTAGAGCLENAGPDRVRNG
jgi:hypothetical protein